MTKEPSLREYVVYSPLFKVILVVMLKVLLKVFVVEVPVGNSRRPSSCVFGASFAELEVKIESESNRDEKKNILIRAAVVRTVRYENIDGCIVNT